MGSVQDETGRVEALGRLCRFRQEFYSCLTRRADALFEAVEAVLCTDGPVRTLVDLTLAPEHRRGHGALYDGLNSGRLEIARLRRARAGVVLPATADGRLVLAVDVSPWLRSDAPTSADRLFCHVHGRAKNQSHLIPGWPYSFVAALEPGRTSWTAVLDAVRLGPCTCRKIRPCRSGGMFVLVQDTAEAVASADVEVGEPVRVGDRFG
jgi:hypothetical protein